MNARGQGGFNLGNAYGEVIIDPQRAIAGLNQAERGILGFGQRVGGALTGLGNQMASLGGDLTTLTAPMLAFGATGVRTASQYEDALKEIEVRAGLTAEQLEAVRDKTMELGLETQFGPAQAADAFLQLLTSGSSVEEAMLQIDSVLAGASASGSELGFTADALTDIMAAFNLEADQSTNVMQALIDASGASSATFPDLVQGFANVGPMARLMGLDVRETAAILATFSENGIKGAEAGTQLRSMMNNMTRTSDPAREAWRSLGIDIWDASGNIRDINELMQDLNDHMEGMSDQQRINTIQQLAGTYGQLGISALLTTDGYDEMLNKMDEGADISEIAASRLETFSGSISFLRGSVELLQIQALTPLMNEVLQPMVMRIADIVNGINEWIQENPELAGQIVRILAAVTALGPALLIAGKALAAIGGIISVALSPIGLIAGAIAALGVAYRENIGGFADFADQMIEGFQRLWMSIGWFIEDLRNLGLQGAILQALGMGEGLGGAESWVEGVLVSFGMTRQAAIDWVFHLTGIYGRLLTITQNTMGTIRQILSTLFEGDFIGGGVLHEDSPIVGFLFSIRDAARRMARAVEPLFREIGEFLGNLDFGELFDAIKPLWDLIRLSNPLGWISMILETFDIDLITIFEQVAAGVTRFFEALNMGQSPLDAIRYALGDPEWLNSFLEGFNSVIGFITGTVLPSLNRLYNWFVTEALPAVLEFVTGTAIPAIQGFIGWLSSIWNAVAPALTQFGNWFLSEVMPRVVSILRDSIIPLVRDVIHWLEDMWEVVGPHLTNLANWFLETAPPAIETGLDAIQDFIDILRGIWNNVSPFLTRLADWFLNTALPDIRNFIEERVVPAIRGFIGILEGIWAAVQPTLQDLYDWFMTNGLPFIEGAIGKISEIVNGFITLLSGIWNTVAPFLQPLIDFFLVGLQNAADFIGGILTDAFNDFIGLVDTLLDGIQWVIDGLNEVLGLSSSIPENAVPVDDIINSSMDVTTGSGGSPIPGLAVGTNYVPEDQLAFLHEGEAVIPRAYNPAAGGMGSGINIGDIVIHANSAAEGRAAAQGFADELDAIFERSGLNYSMGAI